MREWYLMNGTNESTSGYENDIFSDFDNESFSEILQTYIAKDLILYNHDLSEQTNIRGVIQGSTADTQLKSMNRTILCEIGTLKAGMYIWFDDTYWIVTGRPDNNGFYEKSTLCMCNWLLKWQNKDGDIISRWAVIESASKYNDGEDGSKTIVVGSDQLSIQIPLDDEAIKMPRDVKFFIDYNTEDLTVYQLTNPSNVLFRYGENNGVTNWIVKEIAYTPTSDDLEYGVCGYTSPISTPEIDLLNVKISYSGSNTIRVGGNTKKFEASMTDKNGNACNMDAIWTITPTLDGVLNTVDGNTLYISCNNYDLDGDIFEIIAVDKNSGYSATVEVNFSVL